MLKFSGSPGLPTTHVLVNVFLTQKLAEDWKDGFYKLNHPHVVLGWYPMQCEVMEKAPDLYSHFGKRRWSC